MLRITTENKSILISIIITLQLFIFIFCSTHETIINKEKTAKIKYNNTIQLQISNHTNNNIKNKENYIYKIETNQNSVNKNNKIQNNSNNNSRNNTNNNNNNITNNNFHTNSNTILQKVEFYNIEDAKKISQDIIDKKISENLFYPEKAKRRGIEGKISIEVFISKEGNLINYKIISNNNSKILEEASIQTIKNIFPIIELNKKNSKENFYLVLNFIYKLN